MHFSLSSTDTVDACMSRDMSMDAVDYEAESWSLAVEHKYCKKQDKRVVKRQDVIYGEQTDTYQYRDIYRLNSVYILGAKCLRV